MTNSVRFVIVCHARTGSTMLRQLLNSHPDIRCHGEAMGRKGFLSADPKKNRKAEQAGRKLVDLQGRSKVEYLRDTILDPGSFRAIGVKIKYDTLFDPNDAEMLNWLVAQTGIRIIHLFRKNRLKRMISHAATYVIGFNLLTDESKRPTHKPTFKFSHEQCMVDFAKSETLEKRAAELLGGHPVCEIDYEEIIADLDAATRKLTAFLGVELAPLTTPTLKINSDSVADLLENFEEIKRQWAGTPHSAFLEG